ncbi:MAG: hypothetical protein IJ172_00315 [Ruminococcus sp.]|nr:hypothetical protein [Ruminococcus sp.]
MITIHKKKKEPMDMTIRNLFTYIHELEEENVRLKESFQKATGEIAADPLPGAKAITRVQFKHSAKKICESQRNPVSSVACALFSIDLEAALFGDFEEVETDENKNDEKQEQTETNETEAELGLQIF